VASKTIAVLGAGHMGQSALRILLRHRLDDRFRVFDRDERALAALASMTVVDHAMMARGTGLGAAATVDVLLSNGAPAGAHGVEVLDHAQALDTFIALAEEEHAFPDGIIATSAAAAAGGTR
jgi:shikimate 5-dehydrogenase